MSYIIYEFCTYMVDTVQYNLDLSKKYGVCT